MLLPATIFLELRFNVLVAIFIGAFLLEELGY